MPHNHPPPLPTEPSAPGDEEGPAQEGGGARVIHCGPAEQGAALAGLLRRSLGGPTWSQVRRLLRQRYVQVNGNLCLDEGRRLKAGDVVRVLEQPLAPIPTVDDIEIRYLDRHLVVVEKPAGLTTVRHTEERHWPRRRKQLQPTLDELLPACIARAGRAPAQRRPERAEAPGGKKLRPVRPVHRLDRETSGLMVFARTPEAEERLVQAFRKHRIHRAYLAVVWGRPAAGTIETQLVRDRGDGRRGSTTLPDVGQRAVTHVKPLEALGPWTLVECRLETGRTHQIRIHLSEQGHPVSGDRQYVHPEASKAQRTAGPASPRVALHAAELGFWHPIQGTWLQFESRLPADLAAYVAKLRATGGLVAKLGDRTPIVPCAAAPDDAGHEAPAEFRAPRRPPQRKPARPARDGRAPPKQADKKPPRAPRRPRGGGRARG